MRRNKGNPRGKPIRGLRNLMSVLGSLHLLGLMNCVTLTSLLTDKDRVMQNDSGIFFHDIWDFSIFPCESKRSNIMCKKFVNIHCIDAKYLIFVGESSFSRFLGGSASCFLLLVGITKHHNLKLVFSHLILINKSAKGTERAPWRHHFRIPFSSFRIHIPDRFSYSCF